MRTVVSRLIHSGSSLSRSCTASVHQNGKCLSTESNKVDELFKVEEAETVDASPPPAHKLLLGYYEGKYKAAETELLTKFPYGGVILRPGFIYGTHNVGGMKLHLGVIGSPLEMVLQHTKPLKQLPLVGPLFTPPVNVTAVAKVALRAATDPVFPPGIVDVYGILRHTQQRK